MAIIMDTGHQTLVGWHMRGDFWGTVENLLQLCQESLRLRRRAASRVADSFLARTLHDQSLQFARFSGELRAELRLRGYPGPPVPAAFHHGQQGREAATDSAIREEVVRFDDRLLAAYRDALELELPITDLLRDQFAQIEAIRRSLSTWSEFRAA
jgi:hypothetical protein